MFTKPAPDVCKYAQMKHTTDGADIFPDVVFQIVGIKYLRLFKYRVGVEHHIIYSCSHLGSV